MPVLELIKTRVTIKLTKNLSFYQYILDLLEGHVILFINTAQRKTTTC